MTIPNAMKVAAPKMNIQLTSLRGMNWMARRRITPKTMLIQSEVQIES